jgi:hypothetical protein
MTQDWVVLRKYFNQYEADMAAGILEAHGIPALVLSDNAGGALPALALAFPTRLMVQAPDLEIAHTTLSASEAREVGENEDDQDGGEAGAGAPGPGDQLG